MVNVEKLTSRESLLENEINEALSGFSAEEMKLKKNIETSKDINSRTVEEMEAYLNSGELKKRLDAYIQVNGTKVDISSVELDKTNKTLKMKYKVMMDGTSKDITSYFQIVGETNNSYLKFTANPDKKTDITSVELYNNGQTLLPENGYNGGKMFDISIIKTPAKGIDIRIVENERKTKEKILKRVKDFDLAAKFLKPDGTVEDFKDTTLENTKIETLKDTKLGKEAIAEGNGFSRAIFMKEGEKYREIGKVYFNEKGEFDANKTENTQKFNLLGITMNVSIDETNNTFNIENVDALKEQIKKHREILSKYIENSEFGDYTIFTGFNRPKGGRWIQTKRLWLELVEDMYSFKRWERDEDVMNFWFTEDNSLILRDAAGKVVETLTIETADSKKQIEFKDITKNAEKEQLVIQKASKEITKNQEKPELINQPAALEKEYLYNQNGEKLEYHDKKWTLLTKIPAKKTEENKRELGELSEDVQLEDLYKDFKKNMIEKIKKEKNEDKTFEEQLKSINLLDNDIYATFTALRWERGTTINQRETVRVLDDEKMGIYKYYKVEQKKEGEAFTFQDDTELYNETEEIMNGILDNIHTLTKIESTALVYKDKKEKVEKSFTQFVGGSGFLPLSTVEKINFLKEDEKDKGSLTKTFIWGSKTEDIKNFPVQFDITEKKISISEKRQTINNQEYKTRLEDREDNLKLRFDDIE